MAVDPNSKVTLPGSGVLLHVQNPSGESIPVQGTVDGAINTAGGGGGGGTVDQGAAGASSWKVVEDNSADIKTAVQSLATNSPALVTGRVPVDGSGVTQPVSGTFYQATQPVSIATTVAVSGPLTDAELRATAVPVSGTFFQVTQPVSLSSLPALATGTNTIGSAIVKSGAKGAATSAVVTSSPATADIEALHVSIAEIVNGAIPVEQSGAWAFDQGAKQMDPGQAWYTVTTSADGLYIATVKAPSTTAVATDPALVVRVIQAPTTAVTGTFFQAIQPVSIAATVAVSAASLPLPSGASTAAKQPALGTAGTPSVDVISVQGVVGGTAQPISGTVTANVGTTNGLALDATLTGGTARIRIDGAAPIADGTTGVYSRLPTAIAAGGFATFTSGVLVIKGTAGRLRTLYVRYTGATGSGLFVQLHNAATATAPADALILYTWRIDTTFSVIEFAPGFDVACSAGIKLAFSTTATTYTAATTETASVAVWGA
jgi:hypothetical protein